MKQLEKIFLATVLALVLTGTTAAQGLESYWRFDDSEQSITDFSGNNYNLSFKSKTLYFDGVDDYITISHSNRLDFNNTEEWSISVWFQPKFDGTPQVIAGKGDGAHVDGWTLRDNWGGGNLLFRGNDTRLRASNVWNGEWHHAVVSIKENSLELYVDGELRDTSSRKPFGPFNQSSPLLIGDKGNGEYFNGSIADLKIFGEALTSEEASELYSGSSEDLEIISHWTMNHDGRKIPDHRSENDGKWFSPSTVAVYDFDNIIENTVQDKSANNQKGTLQGIKTADINGVNRTIGRIGNALEFNGTNSVNLGVINFTTQPRTVSLWVKTRDSGSQIIGQNANHINWELQQDSNSAHFWMEDGSDADYNVIGDTKINDGGWHHLTASYNPDNDKLRLFIDGVLQGSDTFANPQSPNKPTLLAGGDQSNIEGKIDEVKIYNNILSKKHVKALYQSGIRNLIRNPEFSKHKILNIPFEYENSSHVFDLSKQGSHGIKKNISNSLEPSKCVSGSCYNFSDNYVNLNDLDVNTSSGAKTTVAFWMNWRGGGGMPFGWDTSYDLWFNAGCFGFNTGSGDVYGISSSEIRNRWVHVTAVFYNGQVSNTTNELWINGEKEDIYQCDDTSGSEKVTNDARISSWRTGKGYFFNGKIDDLKIYRKELEKDKIKEISTTRKPENVLEKPPNSSNLSERLELGLNEESGNTAYSHSIISEGVKDSALEFKGYSRGLDIQDSSSLTFQDSITISAWFNLNDWNSELYPDHTSHHLYKSGTFGITTTETRFRGWITDNGTRRHVNGDPHTYNEWHHVVITYNGTKIEMYQNGELTGETTYMGDIDDSDSVLRIGNAGGFDWGTDGKIDEIKISSRALTKQGIKNLYRTQEAEFAQSSAKTPLENSAGQTGIFGTKSYDFNSKDEKAVSEDLLWPQNSFTVSTWIKNNQKWGKSQGTIWQSKNGRVFLRDDSREIWGQGLVFGWYSNGKAYGVTPETNLRKNEWYQVTATYYSKSRDYRLFVNGERQKGSPSISGKIRESSGLKFTSNRQILGNQGWHGKLDETRLYSRSLSTEEIQRLAFQ